MPNAEPRFQSGEGPNTKHTVVFDRELGVKVEAMLPDYLRRKPKLIQHHTSTHESYTWIRDDQVRGP